MEPGTETASATTPMAELSQDALTQSLLNTKLYEDLEAGKYIVKVVNVETKTFDSAKGSWTKCIVNTVVESGGNNKGKGKKVRAEFLIGFKAADGMESESAGCLKAVEIGTRNLRKLLAACGWYSPADGKGAVAKVEQGLARFIDADFRVESALPETKFLATVAKTKDGKYVEITGWADPTTGAIGQTGGATA